MSDDQPPQYPGADGSDHEDEYEAVDYGDDFVGVDEESIEHAYDYEPGGFHPVHLNDRFGSEGRYRVIHKLGHGGFATVWLCKDEASQHSKYVALKIMADDESNDDCPELRTLQLKTLAASQSVTAESSRSLSLPLDHFEITGPNGKHFCFVYELLGPSPPVPPVDTTQDPASILRDQCQQLVKAVAFLHGKSICHGDLTVQNVLSGPVKFDGLQEDEVIAILGQPVKTPERKKRKAVDSAEGIESEPRYHVYPIQWRHMSSEHIGTTPYLIDFGVSFDINKPPSSIGTPQRFRSPEVLLENHIGLEMDLWALACTIFEIRTGRKLFSPWDNEDDPENDYYDHLCAMAQILGKFPEPWWSATWKRRREQFDDDWVPGTIPAKVLAEEERVRKMYEEEDIVTTIHPAFAGHACSLLDKLKAGLWIDPASKKELHFDIDIEEQTLFADLLEKLLKFNPKERISAKEVAEHEWFRYGAGQTETD